MTAKVLIADGGEGARYDLVNPSQPPTAVVARDLTPADLPADIPLANLEDIPAGTVVGRAADALVPGPPAPLLGGDIADIFRYDNLATESVGGAMNNVALGLVDQWRFDGASAVISGVVAPTPATGRELVIENATPVGGGVTVTLLHESTLSSTINRFHIPPGLTGSQVVLRPLETARFRYIISRWKLVGLGGPVTNASVGLQQLQGGILASLLGNTPTATDTTNLSVGAVTVAGNTTAIGTTYIANLSVEFIHTASATPTLTIEWVYGGAVVCTRVLTVTAVAGTYTLWIEGYFRHTTIGAASSARVSIRSVCTAGATVPDQIGDTTATPAALNTTISRTLECRVRMTTTVASNSITLHQGVLQRLINL